jgi:hypothetical protein
MDEADEDRRLPVIVVVSFGLVVDEAVDEPGLLFGGSVSLALRASL